MFSIGYNGLTKWQRAFFIITLVITLNACSSYERAELIYQNKQVDFDQYKTFAWAPEVDSILETEIVLNNAKNFVIHCMSRRDLLLDIHEPDILLDLAISTKHKEELPQVEDDTTDYYSSNPLYYPFYFPGYETYVYDGDAVETVDNKLDTIPFVEQEIVITAFDIDMMEVVWQAKVVGDIYDPDYRNHDVHPGVHQLMKRFPVKARSKFLPQSRFIGFPGYSPYFY